MKLSDKLTAVSDSFQIHLYDNGYMVEVSGRNSSGDWVTAKILVNSVPDLQILVQEAVTMPRE